MIFLYEKLKINKFFGSLLRIVLCLPTVPFINNISEKAVFALHDELIKRNHEVELVRIPFISKPPTKILNSVLSWKLLDLTEANGEKIDLVISTNFPSYVVDHPNHVTWLFHQYRPAYDLRNTEHDELQNDPDGEFVRKKIIDIDNKFLRKVKKIFTVSSAVSKRLMEFNKISSESLELEDMSNDLEFKNKGSMSSTSFKDLNSKWDEIIEKLLVK